MANKRTNSRIAAQIRNVRSIEEERHSLVQEVVLRPPPRYEQPPFLKGGISSGGGGANDDIIDWSEITNIPAEFTPASHDASKVVSGVLNPDRITDATEDEYLKIEGGAITGVPIGYEHTQAVANTSWTVVHNLGFYPNVLVIDSANDTVFGAITYNSLDQLTLTFSGAIAGIAYCS